MARLFLEYVNNVSILISNTPSYIYINNQYVD